MLGKLKSKYSWLLVLALIALPASVMAATTVPIGTPTIGLFSGIFGDQNLAQIITRIIQILLSLIGVLFVLLLIYGGFTWMTASGDGEKVQKAKQIIISAVIGMAIIFASFALATFIWNIFAAPVTPPEPCTAETPNSCWANGCEGTRVCLATGFFDDCIAPTSCTNDRYYDNQFANIFKFIDPSLADWSGVEWGYKNQKNGIVKLPKTDTLRVSAFAHNTTNLGQILNLHLLEAKTSSTERDLGLFTISSSGQNTLINRLTYNFAWGSTTLAATTNIPYSTTTLRIGVDNRLINGTTANNNYFSKSLNVIFCASHYFNDVKDGDETGLNCGPGCLNCDGQSCKKPGSDVCDKNNCSSGLCDDKCLCVSQPVITYIDPALDVLGNTNRLQITNASVTDDISNAGINNYITIFGRNFGSATGTIYFSPIASGTPIEATVAPCVKSWTNNQIVAVVPASATALPILIEANVSSSAQNYNIFVETASTTLTSNKWAFQVNQINRPGICQMVPKSGFFPATTTASGRGFPITSPQNVVWTIGSGSRTVSAFNPDATILSFIPSNVTSTSAYNWSTSQVTDVVPENKIGLSGVRIYNGDVYSNYYNFFISRGGVDDPCGYDSAVCDQDQSTCGVGLNCQNCQKSDPTANNYDPNCLVYKNCTCQNEATGCVYNSNPAQNQTQSCNIGGCPGTQSCTRNNTFEPCTDIATDTCIPYLGKRPGFSIFSWGFLAKKTGRAGMSCSSELWNDGTCDAKGCVDSNLACDFAGSPEEWLEIASTGSLTGYSLATSSVAYDKTPATSTLNNNLLAYWGFDGTSPLKDQKNGINLISESSSGGSVSFSDSVYGQKADFSGVGGKLYSADSTLKPTGAFTISAWAKLDEATPFGARGRLIASTYKWSAVGTPFGWSLGREDSAGTEINFSVADGSGNLVRAWVNNFYTANNLHRWVNIVGVFDPNNDKIYIYVDGQFAARNSIPADLNSIAYDSGTGFTIGRRADDPNAGKWTGGIDEVKLYNKALSATEIKQEYDLSAGYVAISEIVKNNRMTALGATTLGTTNYPVFSSSTLSGIFPLPKEQGSLFLLNSNNDVIDSMSYGGNNPIGFSPGSVGKGDNGFWQYYNKSTLGINNFGRATPPSQIALSELSLAHAPCTCVQKAQMCNKNDKQACANNGLCRQESVCNENGNFGACVQVDPKCIPYPSIASSTLAVFSWGIIANRNADLEEPMVVVDCSGQPNCQGSAPAPSPSPWNGWNQATKPYSNISDSRACLNTSISARFNQPMDLSTLTIDNIKLYQGTSLVPINQIQKEDDKKSFNIVLETILSLDSTYTIALKTSGIKDELGRNLVANPLGVNEDNCSSTPATTSVCWSFETRTSTVPCDLGCVNCAPDQYTASYFGEQIENKVTPTSKDNVCLTLDRTGYSWNWTEQEQPSAPNTWSISTILAQAYSFLLNGVTPALNFTQTIGTPTTGQATTTAQRESNWKPYRSLRNWFNTDTTDNIPNDIDFFKIVGTEVGSQVAGDCRLHNNFTDPVVIENQQCVKSSDPSKRILQSPSPWKGQTDACINAAIFVLFSRNMQNESILGGATGTVYKLATSTKIYKCDTREAAASTTISGLCHEQDYATNGWRAQAFSYSHPNITTEDILNTITSGNEYNKPEGLLIYPPAGEMTVSTWYKVVITGGLAGVRGGITTTPETAEGILRVPQDNARMVSGTGSAEHDSYYWYFQTGTEQCPVDDVNVLPQVNFMATTGLNDKYLADPTSANCNHLNPFSYKWQWNSVINPYSDSCNQNTGDVVATVCDYNSSSACATSFDSSGVAGIFQSKVFGKTEGSTEIKARAIGTGGGSATTCSNDKFGFGDLQIGFGGFTVSGRQVSTKCTNPDIDLSFSKDANSASLVNKLRLYQCGTDAGCSVAGLVGSAIPTTLQFPPTTSGVRNPFYTKKATFRADQSLIPGKTYRAFVMGGSGGVLSASGRPLENLDSMLNGNGGEICDRGVYPWRVGDPFANQCKPVDGATSGCIIYGTTNLCGSVVEQCNNLGLRSFYDFEGTTNSRTGNYNPSNNSISRYMPGKFGLAAGFNSNNYFTISPNSSGTSTLSFNAGTLALWVNVSSTPTSGNYGTIIYDGGTARYGSGTINFSFTSDKKFKFFYGASGTASTTLISPRSYELNTWYYVTAVYDKSSGVVKLFVDGQKVAETTSDAIKNSAVYGVTFPAYIGRLRTVPAGESVDQFTGFMDELAVYDRALSDQEVGALKNLGYPAKIVYGCSNYCQMNGNTFKASCGDRIISQGEDCDDGNMVSGDGCSRRCLLEGSNPKYNAVCSNGVIDTGEQCDDGNVTSGDGCSTVCLSETINNTGSNPGVPICGNGKIEASEQCDDGNTSSSDGCSASCLFTGSTATTCNNGVLDNGQNDSYSFIFTLADDAATCNPLGLGLNPCPNGIWWLTADNKVTDLNLKIYKGQAADHDDNGACKSDAEMRNLGFWSTIFDNIVKIVKRFFGIQVLAADYWCQIAGTSVGQGIDFTADDFAKMAQGQFKTTSTIDGLATTVTLGYTEENGNYKINLIRPENWATSTEYKLIANYTRAGVMATSSQTLRTNKTDCVLTGVRFDIWPKGQTLFNDAFFCQGENCGRFSGNVYDDDMSASWTQNKADNGYNLDRVLNAPATVSYKAGNQHLYRIWGLSNTYTVKETTLENAGSDNAAVGLNLQNITAETSFESVGSPAFYGSYWATAGIKAGRDLLTFRTSTEKLIGSMPIYSFFCNNPWPAAPNFPYVDGSSASSDRCPAGDTTCINTNFSTFYCRDAGVINRCKLGNVWGDACSTPEDCRGGQGECTLYTVDDLPSFADSDGVDGASYITKTTSTINSLNTLKEFLFSTSTGIGAVGIRVYSNMKHLSPLRWYREQFNLTQTGNPTPVIVDGYEAVKDGRTTYVSAGDLNYVSQMTSTIYSNIYLMSFTEGASAEVQNIYKQMLNNWFFNAGTSTSSGLEDAPGTCTQKDFEDITAKNIGVGEGLIPENFVPKLGFTYDFSYITANANQAVEDNIKAQFGESKKGVMLVGNVGTETRAYYSADGNSGWNRTLQNQTIDGIGGIMLLEDLAPTTGYYFDFSTTNPAEPKINLIGKRDNTEKLYVYNVNQNKWFDRSDTEGVAPFTESPTNGGCGTNFKATVGYSFNFIDPKLNIFGKKNNVNAICVWNRDVADGLTANTWYDRTAAHFPSVFPLDFEAKAGYAITAPSAEAGLYVFGQRGSVWSTYLFNRYQDVIVNRDWSDQSAIYIKNGVPFGLPLTTFNSIFSDSDSKIYVVGQDASGKVKIFRSQQEGCYSDIDCLKLDRGYCQSNKSKLTRDVKRLADGQEIIRSLFAYASYKRCSTDHSRGCKTNSDCNGSSAVCGNYYPILDAGSYIIGKTLSVWPSWQNNLAKALGLAKLPLDPLNKLFGCNSPYSTVTCWDDLAKKMGTPARDSAVYYYKVSTTPSGLPQSFRLYLKGEFNPNGLKWNPNWSDAGFYTSSTNPASSQFNPFGEYNTGNMPIR